MYYINTSISEFVDKVKSLDEHNSYALRNNLKHLCLAALPETVDLLNEAIIELVMSESHTLPELCCEVIRQLNASDVELLNNILKHLLDDSRPSYEIVKQKQNDEQGRKIKFHDRNVIYGGRTILWDDFSVKYTKEGKEFNLPFEHYILAKFDANGTDAEHHFLYIGQSLLKLQGLGLLQTEFTVTMGETTSNNISRFHITQLGLEILKYLHPTLNIDYEGGTSR